MYIDFRKNNLQLIGIFTFYCRTFSLRYYFLQILRAAEACHNKNTHNEQYGLVYLR